MKFHDVIKLLLEGDKASYLKKLKQEQLNKQKEKEQERSKKEVVTYSMVESPKFKEDYAWCLKELEKNPNTKSNFFNEIKSMKASLLSSGNLRSHEIVYNNPTPNRWIYNSHLFNSSSDWILLWYKTGNVITLFRIGTHAHLQLKSGKSG